VNFADTNADQIVVICGHGRSGTTYTLNILDCHELTSCRNEPDAISGSLFDLEKLNPKNYSFGKNETARLANLLERLRFTRGERDRSCYVRKAYLKYWLGALLFDSLLGNQKLRLAMSLVSPKLCAGEWNIPRFLLTSAAREVVLVAKLNQAYGACSALLQHPTGIKIIHVVRHPLGMLRSWERRWLRTQDVANVEIANRKRLHRIAELSAPWEKRFGDINKMSVFESELFYWLYGNESLYTLHNSNPRYLALSYGSLVREPASAASRLFGFLGLKVGYGCARRVSNLRNAPKKVDVPSLVDDDQVMKLVSSSPIMRVIDSESGDNTRTVYMI
jgi:hypothetical protein